MKNVTRLVFRLRSIVPAGAVASHAYPIRRVRKSAGMRGHATSTWPVRSEVSFFRTSPPSGSFTTFQLHSRIGVARRSTWTSFAIDECSSRLLTRRPRTPSSLTTVKS